MTIMSKNFKKHSNYTWLSYRLFCNFSIDSHIKCSTSQNVRRCRYPQNLFVIPDNSSSTPTVVTRYARFLLSDKCLNLILCVIGFLHVIPRAQYYNVSSIICSLFYVPTFSGLREIVAGSYVPFLQFCFIW